MKIAYLILTHNQPFHLRRLIDSLTYKENRFYIHVDKRASMSQFDSITSTRAHFIQDRVPCAWADYSLVQATLNLMRSALRSEHEFDYLILLSGVCYPLKSNAYIEEFLGRENSNQFIEAFSFPNSEYGKESIRLDQYWIRRTHPFRNMKCRVQQHLLKLLPKRDYQKAMGGFSTYAGSQWWALTRQACAYALEYVDNQPDYSALYKSSDCPDESFFQTLLMNSPYRDKVAHKIVYTNWPTGEWSPSLITREFLPELTRQVVLDSRDNNCPNSKQEVLFARKFNADSGEVLDAIDLLRAEGTGHRV